MSPNGYGMHRFLGAVTTIVCLVTPGPSGAAAQSDHRIFQEDPGRAEVVARHFDYAKTLLGRKRHDEAIDQFLHVLGLDPRHAEAHFYVGLAYIQKGLTGLQQADHHLSRTIEIDGTNPRAFHYRGVVRMRLGAYEDAVRDFETMVAAEPTYYDSLYSLGATLMRAHRYEDASRVLTRAIDADPSQLEPRWNLEIARRLAGRASEPLGERYRLELPATSESSPVIFEDVALAAGVRRYSRARGSAWLDVDGDGRLDLFTVGIRDPHALFNNVGGGRFQDVTTDSGLLDPTGGWSALAFDYDSDGDPDLYVTRDGWDGELPNSLYRNDDGIFVDVAEAAGVASARDGFTGAVADVNLDGHLDLYVANGVATEGGQPNELFINHGNGRFVDAAHELGVDDHGRSIGSAFGDFDNDGWPDLLVVNFFGDPALYRNIEGARFEDVTARAGIVYPKEGFVGFFFDYDNDGWLDIFMVGFASNMEEALESAISGASVNPSSRLTLYRNAGDGTFTDVTVEAGLDRNFGAMAASFGDVDNDGYLDIFLGCGAPAMERFEPNRLFLNQGGRSFVDISAAARVDHLGKGHGVSFADYDADGDLDVFVPTGGAFQGDRQLSSLYRNPGTDNHWLTVELVGGVRHREAVGAQVRLTVGERSLLQEVAIGGGFGSTSSLALEFGLGAATRVDVLEIRWPGGGRKILRDVEGDRSIRIHESKSGFEVVHRGTGSR